MNLLKFVGREPLEKPTALIDRLQKFLPEIAAANANLDGTKACDIEVNDAVEDEESDTSSSSCSSTDSDDDHEAEDPKGPQVVIDVTTLREDPEDEPNTTTDDDSDGSNAGQEMLPVGFRSQEPVRKRRRLVEEVGEETKEPTVGRSTGEENS